MITLLYAFAGNGLISLLIGLLILAIVVYVFKLILDSIPLNPTVRTIAYLILFLIILLVGLRYFGLF